MGFRRRARYSYYSNPSYTAVLLLCFAWGLSTLLIAGTYGLIPAVLAIVLPTLAVIAHAALPD